MAFGWGVAEMSEDSKTDDVAKLAADVAVDGASQKTIEQLRKIALEMPEARAFIERCMAREVASRLRMVEMEGVLKRCEIEFGTLRFTRKEWDKLWEAIVAQLERVE